MNRIGPNTGWCYIGSLSGRVCFTLTSSQAPPIFPYSSSCHVFLETAPTLSYSNVTFLQLKLYNNNTVLSHNKPIFIYLCLDKEWHFSKNGRRRVEFVFTAFWICQNVIDIIASCTRKTPCSRDMIIIIYFYQDITTILLIHYWLSFDNIIWTYRLKIKKWYTRKLSYYNVFDYGTKCIIGMTCNGA